LCSPQASPHTVCVPTHLAIVRPHSSMDHRYNSLPFSIQNLNSYSFMSQTFMLQDSHMGPPPMMPWGGSPVAGQPPTWPPPPPPVRYWPPPPSGGYWPPPPLVGHLGQSSSTPPHLPGRDTGPRRRGHLQLEGKPHRGECLRGRHRHCSCSDLLLHHLRQVICAYFQLFY
jgi:hypothetical protein